mmetsp:Transcript_3530/g.6833  ORF Transcript_3530/g.6833 Transcript_3530/m.6833 type:complete len:316 (-) Transcript_3530:976-1923(-)
MARNEEEAISLLSSDTVSPIQSSRSPAEDVSEDHDFREAFEKYQPPAFKTKAKFKHLTLDTSLLEEDSPLRRSSRSLLEKNSPRSPNARRIQQYDLSISGAATEHNLNQQEQDEDSLSTKVKRLTNSYDRVVMVLSERLESLRDVANSNTSKASSAPFRRLLAGLCKDTHKLYKLLHATLILLDGENTEETEDMKRLDRFNYDLIAEDTNFNIGLASLQRWLGPQGKIHCAFQELDKQLLEIRREGLSFDSLPLSAHGFDKIDEVCTRCLERIDAAAQYLRQMNMRGAATAVQAAVRLLKTSPTAWASRVRVKGL